MDKPKSIKKPIELHPSFNRILDRYRDQVDVAKREYSLLKQDQERLLQRVSDRREMSSFLKKIQVLVSKDDRIKIANWQTSNTIWNSLSTRTFDTTADIAELSNLLNGYSEHRKMIRTEFDRYLNIIFAISCFVALMIVVFAPICNFSVVGLILLRLVELALIISVLVLLKLGVQDLYGDEHRKEHLEKEIRKLRLEQFRTSKSLHQPAWLINNFPIEGLDFLSNNLEIRKEQVVTFNYTDNKRTHFLAADAFSARLIEIINAENWSWNCEASKFHLKWVVRIFSSVDKKKFESSSFCTEKLGFDAEHLMKLFNSFSFVQLTMHDGNQILFCIPWDNIVDGSIKWSEIKPMAGYSRDELVEYLMYTDVKKSDISKAN